MPCNGVAVISATVAIAVGDRWRTDQALREGLVADLKAQGFKARATTYCLYVNEARVDFYRTRIDADTTIGNAALSAIQQYLNELAQAEVLEALQAEGIQVSNVQVNNGTLLFDFAAKELA